MEYDITSGNSRSSQAGSESLIYDWTKVQELKSGKYTLWDHTFESPDKPTGTELHGSYNFLLEVAGVTPDQPAAGAAVHPDWFVA
jgi:hypothetical protein